MYFRSFSVADRGAEVSESFFSSPELLKRSEFRRISVNSQVLVGRCCDRRNV